MKSQYAFILLLLVFFSNTVTYADRYADSRYHGNRRRGSLDPITGEEKVVKKTVTVVAPVVLPAPVGPKKLIAVAEFENKTNWSGQVNLGTGMADQLITALMNTQRFIVLERQSIEAVLQEQNIGASSRVTSEGGAKIGEISRAQILIQGAITEFQESTSGGGGFTYGGVTIASSEARAHVAVDVRVYDTTTGQILASKACKGTAVASAGSFGYADGNWGFAAGGQAKTPLDLAVRDAITQAVDFIVVELQRIPWEGRIAAVKENDIFINCGRTTGILVGDQFSVFKPGESIIDPETGLNLGSENKFFGKIEVIKVDEKFSKAVPIEGTSFERNDILKYEGPKPIVLPPAAVPVQPATPVKSIRQ